MYLYYFNKSISPKFIYKLNAIPSGLFGKSDKLNLVRVTKRILETKSRVGRGGGVTEQTGGYDILLPKGPPLSLWGSPPHLLGSPCPPPEERHLSMPEIGEKERNYLFKSYTDLD